MKEKRTKKLECNKCGEEQEIEVEYKKEFWKCNNCGTSNTCTHYMDKCHGFSKKESNLLSALGKRRYQPR